MNVLSSEISIEKKNFVIQFMYYENQQNNLVNH